MPALLVPVHLGARVLTSTTTAPSLSGTPFGSELQLQAGVHLCWALPDALTRARYIERGAKVEQIACPGVPDRWLVVRFHAVKTTLLLGKSVLSRPWRAWVVESDSGKVTPLDQYKPPTTAPTKVLTASGPLDPASRWDPELAGWGSYPKGTAPPWGMGQHAYYPSSVGVFGLHDDLSDLSDRASAISYAVVGWCSEPANDPVASAPEPAALCLSFKWSLLDLVTTPALLATLFDPDSRGAGVLVEATQTSTITAVTSPITEAARASAASLRGAAGAAKTAGLLDGGRFAARSGPDRLICHGAVYAVNPSAPAPSRVSYTLTAHPTLPRAVAETVGSDADAQDAAEALIQGLDRQLTSPRDAMDLAYEAHARAFEERPGEESRWFGQIRVSASGAPVKLAGATGRAAVERAISAVVQTHAEIRAAQSAFQAARAARGLAPVHARLVRVVDTRGEGDKSWWVDIERDHEVMDLARRAAGAKLELQDVVPVFATSAPRWRRARAPVLLLKGAGRGFRHGEDGRFEADGTLRCRLAGQTVRAVEIRRFGEPSVTTVASRLLADVAKVRDRAGLPTAAVALMEEALILDPVCDPMLAWLHYQSEDRPPSVTLSDLTSWYALYHAGMLDLRDPDSTLAPGVQKALVPQGRLPSPVGWAAWEAPWCPLFLDASYSFADRSTGDPKDVERSLGSATGTTTNLTERSWLMPSATRTLHGALFNRWQIGPDGVRAELMSPPTHVTERQVQGLDLLTASLSKLDTTLAERGRKLIAGDLSVSKARVVDTFGGTAGWLGGAKRSLYARPATWTRAQLRLVDGTSGVSEAPSEADRTRPAVAGYLVPDLLEHALEIYDEHGEALGQVVGDDPVIQTLEAGNDVKQISRHLPEDRKLRSTFRWHPWVTDQRLERLNPNLRSLLDALTACPTDIPSATERPSSTWDLYEPAVSALVRVGDTARATLDQRRKHNKHEWSAVGRPMVLLRAAAWVESAAQQGTTMVAVTPPELSLRLGDLRFADDGVVGRIENGKLIPVDPVAATQAMLNVLPEARQDGSPLGALAKQLGHDAPVIKTAAVRSPFIDVDPSHTLVPLTNTPRQLLLLVDLGGVIRGVTGALPVKRLAVPADQIAEAMGRLNPTFAVGPVLCGGALEGAADGRPRAPALALGLAPGRPARWIHDDGEDYPEDPIPPVRKDSLPRARVRVSRGWVTTSSERGT